MADLLIRVDDGIAKLEAITLFLIMTILVVFLFLQVLFRFVFENPLAFTVELARMMLIWLTFIGAARAAYAGEHFVVDFAVDALPRWAQHVIGLLMDLLTVLFIGTMVWFGWQEAVGSSLQILPVLGISVMVQNIAMPIGFALMGLHVVVATVRRHRPYTDRANGDESGLYSKTNEAS